MATLADDGVPPQPPHPTMPPYIMTETFTPPDALKFRTERRRIAIEQTEQSCGRETYVQPSLVMPTTMEINMKMAGHHTALCIATLTKDSYVMPQLTMPLPTLTTFPPTQHHNHCIETPKALDHTPANKQCTCHMGNPLGHIVPHIDRQNHAPIIQRTNKGQKEAQHCHTLCGWSLHSAKLAPANTHTHHITRTNTASNIQTINNRKK